MRERLLRTSPATTAGIALAVLQRAALICAIVVAVAVAPAAFAAVAGYDTYVVTGGSMAPAVRDGSLVISRRVDPAAVSPGDIITFRHPDRPTVPVTHRVMQVFDDSGGRFFQTKGDANAAADADLVHADRPISLMSVTLPHAGRVISALRTLPGQIALVVLPALLLATRVVPPWLARIRAASRETATIPVDSAPAPGDADSPPDAGESASRFSIPQVLPFALRRREQGGGDPVASPEPAAVAPPLATPPRAEHLHSVAPRDTERMRRLSAIARSHTELGQDLERVADALQPVRDLLDRHESAAMELEANLDRELEPVREYADSLQTNLDQLLARLEEEGSAASHALRAQFRDEQRRVEQVRATMEEPRERLREAIRAESRAIDAVLAGFDPDLDQLERTLADQRRDLRRIAAQLQSDQFGEALSFLRDRSSELTAVARAGIADADEVEATLRLSLDRARRDPRRSAHLGRALDAFQDAAEDGASGERRNQAV